MQWQETAPELGDGCWKQTWFKRLNFAGMFSSRVETPIPTPKKFCCVISETWILPILVLLAIMVYAVSMYRVFFLTGPTLNLLSVGR